MKLYVVVASETPTLDEEVYLFTDEDKAYSKKLDIMFHDLHQKSEVYGTEYALTDKVYDANSTDNRLKQEDEDRYYRIIGRYVRIYEF